MHALRRPVGRLADSAPGSEIPKLVIKQRCLGGPPIRDGPRRWHDGDGFPQPLSSALHVTVGMTWRRSCGQHRCSLRQAVEDASCARELREFFTTAEHVPH